MKFAPGDLVAWECECDSTGAVTIELGIIKELAGINPAYPIVEVMTPEGVHRFTKDSIWLVNRYKRAE